MVTLPSCLVSTDVGTWSFQCSLFNFTAISLHILQYSSAHALSRLFLYCYFASIGHVDMMCSTISSNCLQSLHLLSVCYYY